MEMAYYVWLIRNSERTIVVDTGFGPTVAEARGREFLICPGEAICRLGTDPERIDTVVLTHLHYDHAGNHHLFRDATYHIQAAELAYVTSPWMKHPYLRAGYGADDVKQMIDRIFAEQVVWHEGDEPLCPGIDLIQIGGHCAGLQSLVVATDRGPVVIASDAAVFYEGLETGRAFPAAFHVGDELEGHKRLLSLAGGADAIIPGHDAQVMQRYPMAIDGVAWRVDLAPIAP